MKQKGDHIPEGEVPSDYNSMPPTTGKMWEGQATGGFNEQAVPLPLPVHNLEHGQFVVYYGPDSPSGSG
jgi:hypothetical protein